MYTHRHIQTEVHIQREKSWDQESIVIVMKLGLMLNSLGWRWVTPPMWPQAASVVIFRWAKPSLGYYSTSCLMNGQVPDVWQPPMALTSSVCERRGIKYNLVKWEVDTEPLDLQLSLLSTGSIRLEFVLTSLRLLILYCQTDWWPHSIWQVLPCTGSITTPNFQACLLLDHMIYTCFQFSLRL